MRADVRVRMRPGADAASLFTALFAYSVPGALTSHVTKAIGFEASPVRKALNCVPAAMLCAMIFKVMQFMCNPLDCTKRISLYGECHFNTVHQ